jgi:peroxiredoxin
MAELISLKIQNSASKDIIMNRPLSQEAPDFALEDYQGQPVSLSDYKSKKNVVLIFNRGFM